MTVHETRELEPSTDRPALGTLPPPIRALEIVAAPHVHEQLAALGRTEDVRLSPSRRRLAIACFAIDRIAIASIELTPSQLRVEAVDLLASPAIREPHGVDFADETTLVVASRLGGLSVVELPPGDAPAAWRVQPTIVVEPRDAREAPGSVAVRAHAEGGHELLVCVNWAHALERRRLHAGVLSAGEIVARQWLDVPDGVAISDDARWVAVSNHFTHSVFVYERASLGESAEPVAVLRGVRYPHGLRFSADGHRLLVADAGAPYVHVFAATPQGWRGASYPAATVRVMDDAAFARGHHNPQEGGPKGLELDRETNVAIVTSEETPLLCFDARPLVDDPWRIGTEPDVLLGYELHVVEGPDATTPSSRVARELAPAFAEADARAAELADRLAAEQEQRRVAEEATKHLAAELAAIRGTRSWRLLEPPRRAYGAVRRRLHR